MALNPEVEKTSERVWVSKFPFEREDGILVSFGAISSKFTYGDGSEGESHLIFNKALWEIAGKPCQIVVAWSANDDFLQYKEKAEKYDCIMEAVANDSLASDGMEMIQSAMRDD